VVVPDSASAEGKKPEPAAEKPAADARTDKPADADKAEKPESDSAPADPRTGKPADAAKAEKAEKAEKPASADSERTAVFRAVKPASDAPKKPSEDVRTTAFGVVIPDSASAEGNKKSEPAAEKPAADPRTDKPADAPKAEKPASADSERTAVFRAVKPASDAPKKPSGDVRTTSFGVVVPDSASPADKKPAQGPSTGKPVDADKADQAEKPEPADSERTAVFRAVKPGAAPTADKKPAQGPSTGKPADAEKAEQAEKPEPADSERTAVFRAVKPGSAPAADKKPAQDPRTGKPADADKADRAEKPEAADSERTAVFRAVKPGSAPAAADKKPTDAGKGDARASTFVPLRGDGPQAQPKPTPKPAAATPPVSTPRPAPATPHNSERTTQQPLPPRPPLDMLADLTNNPPPPPSPIRTAVRRFKIYAPIVLLLAIVLAVVQMVRPLPAPKLAMTAKSTYAFPGGKPDLPWPTEGQASMAAAGLGTIGSSGEQKPVPIASVTKSMTAYIILRDHPFKKGEKGAMIDVDKTAETEGQKDKSDNESTLNTVKEGDKISEYDAVAALMIPSANNIARLLARWDSGSQEAFVKKMNDTAKELGMTNTTYTDPSGLDATTVSTAEDQVKLGLKIVEIPALVDITRMPSWVDPSGKTWPNWNRLVPFNDSLGIKTGTTTKAGGNLLFAAQKKVGDTNQLIVGAVLGQHKPPIIDSVIAASKTLLVATQKAIEGATVVKKGEVVGYVDDGLGGRTPVVATADVQAVGWSSLTVAIKLGDGGTPIPETAKAGTQVGVLTVGEGASQVKVPVALQRELVSPGLGSKLTRIG
ncbi:hypothetical protein, partial [Streptomyces sp. NPDC059564]|uniref:hypothetical protein n=1 Tax=Streptomyces sp. NPDC059564 TaxID=3346865 RepID=UPI0036D09A6C